MATSHVQMIHAWLPQLLKEHNVTTITSTGHSLGGGLATLSAFDVGQHLEQNWERWDKAGWQTQKRPQVRLVAFAAPRLGNACFVDAFHKLGIEALRIENQGDIVPNVPGVCVFSGGKIGAAEQHIAQWAPMLMLRQPVERRRCPARHAMQQTQSYYSWWPHIRSAIISHSC
jgi:hypothetical protein